MLDGLHMCSNVHIDMYMYIHLRVYVVNTTYNYKLTYKIPANIFLRIRIEFWQNVDSVRIRYENFINGWHEI